MFTTSSRASSPECSAMRAAVGPALARDYGFTRHRGRASDPNTDGDVSRHDVLILSADPLAAALLGAVVELAGHACLFPQPGEGGRAALIRLRPRVVLVDCDHDEGCSEEFIGPALMTGARVQLFSARRAEGNADALARALGLTIVQLPMDPADFATLLHELSGTTT
jgi:hypothetical protein